MTLARLLSEVAGCELCREHLPLGPRPLLKVDAAAKLLIVGQAPGRLAHVSGTPWNDPSGDRLRDWLGISRETFYENPVVGIMPMGFCFPGTGKGGDLPPRPECAATWHRQLLAELPQLETSLVIGRYAQLAYLPAHTRSSVAETVRDWRRTYPRLVPLPHPSPRNNRWLKNNPWLEAEVLPALRKQVARLLA